MQQNLRRLVMILIATAFAVAAIPASAQTYTSINIQSTGSPTDKMHWAGIDPVELRVTLWFPEDSPCYSSTVLLRVSSGTLTPEQAAEDLAKIIRDLWPGLEVSDKGRTVTVWGTDPDRAEGTPEKPKVQTTGNRKGSPRVSYFTNSL